MPSKPTSLVNQSQYSCPFGVHVKANCPFGHLSTSGTRTLRPLPSNICFYHLVNQCNNQVFKVGRPQLKLTRCLDGFHTTNADMADLEAFQRKILSDQFEQPTIIDQTSSLESSSKSLPPSKPRKSKRSKTRRLSISSKKSLSLESMGSPSADNPTTLDETSALCYLGICMGAITICYCISLPLLIMWYFGYLLIRDT